MAYLKEAEVRAAAKSDSRISVQKKDAAKILKESVETASATTTFDVFLSHAIKDAEIVLGATNILTSRGLSVYVDWIVDPAMERSEVTAETAGILRTRMKQSRSLLYLYSTNSQRSRWMPWELGFFDGFSGAVAVLPIVSDNGTADFSKEEYLGLYPKVEIASTSIFVNRTRKDPVSADDKSNYRSFTEWVKAPEVLRMTK